MNEHSSFENLDFSESKLRMSDDGVRILCRLRLNYQNRFDNKSDKNENIWKHLEVDFNAKI